MAEKKQDNGYAENIEHGQDTHPDPWPGIRGRSEEHEEELPTGTSREAQAEVTRAQRKLEHDVHGDRGE